MGQFKVKILVGLIRKITIAQLGHLPKYSSDSSKAWLYGKLFVALLTEKLINHASSISPWGYVLEEQPTPERLA